ncbi:MAG: hypothetical protein VR69_06190 [Peptococcaceae bacterium BRH_c4b]|nr:MAG: hypothetical protein VR69_06190 [Peptococcaceae bacterium BRH_c4b]
MKAKPLLKALVLSGGEGTRMRPLTHTIPKQLIPVANKPTIFYIMEQISSLGIKDVGVVISPRTGELVKKSLGDGGRWHFNITYILQDKPAGLAHAVWVAGDFLGNHPFLMFLGDNLVKPGFEEMLGTFADGRCDAGVLIKPVSEPERFGVAIVDKHFNILRLVEKPRDPASNYALVGVYLFNENIHKAIREITPSARGELEITDAIQRLLETGGNVTARVQEGWWFDTGCKEDLLEANSVLLDERCTRRIEGGVDDKSHVEGRVETGLGSSIYDSVVLGPVVLGEGVTVKNSHIGPYCSIGKNCTLEEVRVENSIILDDSVFGMVYLKESLVGRHCRIKGNSAIEAAVTLNLGDWSEIGPAVVSHRNTGLTKGGQRSGDTPS